ncbi:hypothetical protein Acr_00g0001720 [Actinidia rufa]|uniref:H(+)-transporting two-sector ATPase n=1 Tax=Actinidia rufa TaxID=165716 RepID=A0A7J0D839_9ERIC|nr:hypothetical protein Acr_00g0001720 [Actinidia rufa]
MPQLDKFTYFTQFFWSCLFLFTFYIPICNDGDGILGISRILKLRNQLVSHRENNIRNNDPKSFEDILRKGFSTGVSYMYSSLFEVSQWCNAVDLLGKRRKSTFLSCFGEISGSRGMERNIFYLISKSSYSTSSNASDVRLPEPRSAGLPNADSPVQPPQAEPAEGPRLPAQEGDIAGPTPIPEASIPVPSPLNGEGIASGVGSELEGRPEIPSPNLPDQQAALPLHPPIPPVIPNRGGKAPVRQRRETPLPAQ